MQGTPTPAPASAQPPFLTRQEIFNRSALHLLAQGHPSKNGEKCAYMGAGGTSCAVGCLIPESHRDPNFDSSAWAAQFHAFSGTGVHNMAKIPAFVDALAAGGVDVRDLETRRLLRALQETHDTAEASPVDPLGWVGAVASELLALARARALDAGVVRAWLNRHLVPDNAIAGA